MLTFNIGGCGHYICMFLQMLIFKRAILIEQCLSVQNSFSIYKNSAVS